ncbi:MAG TPA: DUF1800 family protein [Pyrinomonadaceae bacterium]|nr:DUF1800 family protein [Pyrinomonadaceae bacterium]
MKSSCIKLSFVLPLPLLFIAPVLPQTDPDPNSPVPILTSEADSVKRRERVVMPGRDNFIQLYVSNITLMKGEGANAFRIYLVQKSGKTFELEIAGAEAVSRNKYALTVRLADPNGYRGQPIADGESLVYLTWRGLVSNYIKVSLGSSSGEIKIPETLKTNSTADPTGQLVGYRWSGDRIRFLEQAAFGPSTEVDNRLRRIGLRTWLAEQFEAPYPTYPYPNPPQMPSNPPSDCLATTNPTCFRERYTMFPIQQWFFMEALYGNSPLRHRTAWALSQIWVTSGVTTQQASHEIAFNKILSRNAFGNYYDLMREATLSPTMGNYLDMVRSTKTNPNENYPREVLQLFSIGLFMLNQDGTFQRDNQGNPIPTYSQETINNFAKVFTGWTYCNFNCPNSALGVLNYKDPMILTPANHDLTEKTLLNYPNAVDETIDACSNCTSDTATRAYADESLNKALLNIFNHPNVGPYIGKLLIQHLVTSDPSPAYVGRVAAAFNDNGSGVRGDLKAVIKAILLDPEARGDFKTAPRYGKLREPVQLITNLGRIFPAKDFNGTSLSDGSLHSYSSSMGQNPFYSPTVFNYFLPNFVIPGSTTISPEFQLMNTATTVKRTNFLYLLIFEGITPNSGDSLRGTSLDLSGVVPFAEADPSGNQLLDALDHQMLHSSLSSEQRNLILSAVQIVPATNPLLRTKTAVYLIAASLQYQVQR